MMKNNDCGRSMIEMMGVLAIIGALSVGGIAGYSKMLNQSKINKAIEQINVISGQLSTIGAGGGTYSGISNKTAIKLKAVLDDMVTGASTIKNPFGGDVTIASSNMMSVNGGDIDNMAYFIKYGGLNHQACMAMATHDWGSAKNSSFIAFMVGSESAVNANGLKNYPLNCAGSGYNLSVSVGCNNGSSVGVPLPVTEAATACASCRNNSSCAVAVKYY